MSRRMQYSSGSVYIELILKTVVFFTLILTAMLFFSVFMRYANLSYAARRVVREIEISGQVSQKTTDLFNQLKAQSNVGDATMEVTDVTYFDHTKKIQLRETFTVVCRSSYRLDILSPILGPPVGIDIPLQVKLSGMSEKFWK